jgi:hypothetical protein
MSLDDFRNIAAIIGVFFTAFTFFKGIIEYVKQGSQKRAEHFDIMRKKLKENNVFKNICTLLETDNKELENISFADKRDFLGFFEEIALMMNSGIIKKEVVHYMFGYYAIQCWDSNSFWININRKSIYWRLFKEFAIAMKRIENKCKFRNAHYKF